MKNNLKLKKENSSYGRNLNFKWNVDLNNNLILIDNNIIYEIDGFFVEIWNALEYPKNIEEILQYCTERFEKLPENVRDQIKNELNFGIKEGYIIKKE